MKEYKNTSKILFVLDVDNCNEIENKILKILN